MSRSRKIVWIALIVIAAVIKLFSFFPGAVERTYSMGLYLLIARLQRILFGWMPFSIGDIFYAAVTIWLLVGLFSLIRRIVRRQANGSYFLSVSRQWIFAFLLLYVVFNLLWGLNYDRKGIADQLQLQVRPYSNAELTDLLQVIVTRLNGLDSAALQNRPSLENEQVLFGQAAKSYSNLAALDPRFAYPSPSVKASLFSCLGNYLGFSGYYNPFSGEAQVNVNMPGFTQPYTTCHEIGHQMGYAKENEANFAGYLSARSSTDPTFRYSVYFDLYIYASRELYLRDSNLVKPLRAQLHPRILQDFRELQQFLKKYRNPLEPLIAGLYGRYLRANRQPQGIRTYNEVIAWLIAYYKKNGASAV
ncbi:MAG: DUF3810 domain-containing protein [Bacteroidota bacterium]|nr:DUF3810 domain-containing protein [Bacteroidota bacterium]